MTKCSTHLRGALMKFVDVPGLEDYFQVSKCGKVFSKRSNKLLKTVIHKNGYEVFCTRLQGREGKANEFEIKEINRKREEKVEEIVEEKVEGR